LQNLKRTGRQPKNNINQKLIGQTADKLKERALIMIGAVGAVNHIAATLSAQTMRGLQTIRDEKIFESFGYTRFDDFLNESEFSPMSYRQFIDREKLLENEGEKLFDVLNMSGMSHKQRRLLGSGYVQVDEAKGTVLIVTGEDMEEDVEEIELSDRNRLLQTLSALADQAAVLNQKNSKQKQQIERGEQQVEDLKKKLDEAKDKPGSVSIFDMWLNACRSIDAMTEMVKKASDVEKAQGGIYIDAIQNSVHRLKDAYGRKPYGEMSDDEIKKSVAKKVKNIQAFDEHEDELAALTSSMDEDELAALMEE
jgi:hypothetical protein